MLEIGNEGIERLKSFVERIERLEEERKALSEDIREVYMEAKNRGFTIKVIRQIVKLRQMDTNDRTQMEEMLEIYKNALEM